MVVFFLGIVLFATGVLSFFLANPERQIDSEKATIESERDTFFHKAVDFVKRIKDRVVSFFSSIRKGFRYVKDLIRKVILPRLSIEQRSKFYSAVRFLSSVKDFVLSTYYFILCAFALFIIFHYGKKIFSRYRQS